jgi:hypothetical protein
MTTKRLSFTIFVCIILIFTLMWLYVARHMPLHNFAWSCLLIGAYSALELTVRKSLSERINKNSRVGILLELGLALVFLALFYWFGMNILTGGGQ